MTPARAVAAAAAIAVLSVGGCGGGEDGATEATTTTSASFAGQPEYCGVLRDFARINRELPNESDLARLPGDERRRFVEESQRVYERMVDEAPDEVEADARAFGEAQLVISHAVEDAGYDASTLDPSDPDIARAVQDVARTSTPLQSYAQQRCGGLSLSSTGG